MSLLLAALREPIQLTNSVSGKTNLNHMELVSTVPLTMSILGHSLALETLTSTMGRLGGLTSFQN